MKAIFIAGTDTGVGKSVITGLLGRYLLDKGYKVVTQKWVETGCRKGPSDIDTHLELMGKKRNDFEEYLPFMEPYKFKFAASPHLAARLERKKIDEKKIRKSFEALTKNFDFVLVEGAGGLFVPVATKRLLIDIVGSLGLPVILVAANRLGAINHTLLAIEALKKRRIKTIGIIFNRVSKKEHPKILKDNPAAVRKFSGVTILGEVPYQYE